MFLSEVVPSSHARRAVDFRRWLAARDWITDYGLVVVLAKYVLCVFVQKPDINRNTSRIRDSQRA